MSRKKGYVPFGQFRVLTRPFPGAAPGSMAAFNDELYEEVFNAPEMHHVEEWLDANHNKFLNVTLYVVQVRELIDIPGLPPAGDPRWVKLDGSVKPGVDNPPAA